MRLKPDELRGNEIIDVAGVLIDVHTVLPIVKTINPGEPVDHYAVMAWFDLKPDQEVNVVGLREGKAEPDEEPPRRRRSLWGLRW